MEGVFFISFRGIACWDVSGLNCYLFGVAVLISRRACRAALSTTVVRDGLLLLLRCRPRPPCDPPCSDLRKIGIVFSQGYSVGRAIRGNGRAMRTHTLDELFTAAQHSKKLKLLQCDRARSLRSTRYTCITCRYGAVNRIVCTSMGCSTQNLRSIR